MEQLHYMIEDSTIAQLLGIQNFTNDESAILELVKNAYDACAVNVILEFQGDSLIVQDNGVGMNADDIRQHWMHIGKSSKEYLIKDSDNKPRIMAGSKGVGRFALARLGESAKMFTKRADCEGIIWETDWNSSVLYADNTINDHGTRIIICNLREKWNKKKLQNLTSFLSKTYNDTSMQIMISSQDYSQTISAYFPLPIQGKNCLSIITLKYDAQTQVLSTYIRSDEFQKEAEYYCQDIDLYKMVIQNNMVDELKASTTFDFGEEELSQHLMKLGSFTAEFYFSLKPSSIDVEKFLYKHKDLPESIPSGIILYRNAFGISSYEGKKDWLGLGKRARKSPAAATHATGAWRVRENQISGKVEIDKKENAVLQDLSNRQGLDENVFYDLFVETILTGISEFERYRQRIIRLINVKNSEHKPIPMPVSEKVVSNPKAIPSLTADEAKQLVQEIKAYKAENKEVRREIVVVENRYKYDVRILNVLATIGLKASSIAHEMRNDRNIIVENTENIIEALKEYGYWEELQSPEKTATAYNNVPYLLESNKAASSKIIAFMRAMLSEVEKQQFEPHWQSVIDILEHIRQNWIKDYAWISINIENEDDLCFYISEDILRVIFDNLILNSIQQNERMNHLNISISVHQRDDALVFLYKDNGQGLDKKYHANPRRILEVHETTRKNGHGLGMWIVHNTVVMSGGAINDIRGTDGFSIDLTIGGTKE